MTSRRVQIGRHLRVVRETSEDVHLEGQMRLQPGRDIELVAASSSTAQAAIRRAHVLTWSVVALGSDGPTYAGACRWE